MKTYREYEYILTFEHSIIQKKVYHKDFKGAVREAVKRLENVKYPGSLIKFEVRYTGLSMAK